MNYIEVESSEKLVDSLKVLDQEPIRVLGGGSNILMTKDLSGTTIKNGIQGITVKEENKQSVLVRVGGGVDWHDLVKWSVDRDLGGLENLSLIPGTVGAAPVQNIGAYGVELSDVFDDLELVFLADGQTKVFKKKDCEFGYRTSIFKLALKGKVFITHVTLKLSKQHVLNLAYGSVKKALDEKGHFKPSIRQVSDTICEIRRSKLPYDGPTKSAGSFFKNPLVSVDSFRLLQQNYASMPFYKVSTSEVKIPAAWLIEKTGWKGKRVGDTGTYEHHALVIVNRGNASGKEIWECAERIASDVKRVFDIELEPEVNVW